MSQHLSLPPLETTAEISALIETLVHTERRLAELTAGEVDTVADQQGRTLMLRRSQDALRNSEAYKQAAILNALPANIAVLDAHGVIVSVNESWRSFGAANGLLSPNMSVGVNYLDVCDVASSKEVSKASQVGAGIRSVMSGGSQQFSIEYPCHSPLVQRWFLMTVTPLSQDHAIGAVVMHLDITAEWLAGESLVASELRFRQMADQITDIFFLQNLDNTKIYYVSPAYERIWGRSCESLYANPMSWADAIHPDDLDYAITQMREGRNSGFDYEFRIIRSGGEIRWIHARGFPILDAAGEPYRTAGVCTDITERKQATNELRNSEARFRSLAVLSSDWFWEQDEEYRFVELAGRELDEPGLVNDQKNLIGRRRWEVLGAAPLSESWAQHKALLDARKPFRNFEQQRALGNGTLRYISTSGEPIFDVNGNFIGYRGVSTDITERKRMEEAMRASELQQRQLADELEIERSRLVAAQRVAKVGSWEKDVATLPIRWSEETHRIFETDPATFRPTHDAILAIVHPEDRARESEAFAHSLVGSAASKCIHLRLLFPDGRIKHVEKRWQVYFDENQQPVRVIGTSQDITERTRAEDEIRALNNDLERRVNERTAELEAANRELEAFDYSVAHDLRAPIRHIEGFSSMLLEDYGDKLDARGRECLEKVQGAGKRMELLVGDLLALSLVSRCKLNRSDVDLSALAQTVFASLQEAESERDIDCVISPGISVNADIGLMRIVLENLIGNAWKFTGKQRRAKIEFGCALQDNVPTCFVRDNGAGFDQSYADRLFAPFQRLHAQSEFKGTGIGLATVSRIITRHGGKVWAEGTVDHGATVYFTLPL